MIVKSCSNSCLSFGLNRFRFSFIIYFFVSLIFFTTIGSRESHARSEGIFGQIAEKLISEISGIVSRTAVGDYLRSQRTAETDAKVCEVLSQSAKKGNKNVPMAIDEMTTLVGMYIDCDNKAAVYLKRIEIKKMEYLELYGLSSFDPVEDRIRTDVINGQCPGLRGLKKLDVSAWSCKYSDLIRRKSKSRFDMIVRWP